jgi:hypothetical protein
LYESAGPAATEPRQQRRLVIESHLAGNGAAGQGNAQITDAGP